MNQIKIHVLHTGKALVSPSLPFGGMNSNIIKASGIFASKNKKIWLPVSVYLIEHPKGLILVDTGWNREMSPQGVFDKKSQIKHLGSRLLYMVNHGIVPDGQAVHEQLKTLGYSPSDLDYVLITHLDCDHVSGLTQVKEAKNILVAEDELKFANKNKIRYKEKWWKNIPLTTFSWNDTEGPFHSSYDLFGDKSIQLINLVGHSDGLFAVKVSNCEEKFVLLVSDAGYADKSWKELIPPGISSSKKKQIISLKWIKKQSEMENCIDILANHDAKIKPFVINL